jgi:hypothetical protein
MGLLKQEAGIIENQTYNVFGVTHLQHELTTSVEIYCNAIPIQEQGFNCA